MVGAAEKQMHPCEGCHHVSAMLEVCAWTPRAHGPQLGLSPPVPLWPHTPSAELLAACVCVCVHMCTRPCITLFFHETRYHLSHQNNWKTLSASNMSRGLPPWSLPPATPQDAVNISAWLTMDLLLFPSEASPGLPLVPQDGWMWHQRIRWNPPPACTCLSFHPSTPPHGSLG